MGELYVVYPSLRNPLKIASGWTTHVNFWAQMVVPVMTLLVMARLVSMVLTCVQIAQS